MSYSESTSIQADAVPRARMAPPPDVIARNCPLCEKELSSRWLRKSINRNGLFGVVVCKKCRSKFASRRQIAYLLDGLVMWLVGYAAGYAYIRLVAPVAPPTPRGPALMVTPGYVALLVVTWLIFPLIFCCKDGFSGYSPGKRLMGVRVVDRVNREPISFSRSFKRNLILCVPYVGVLWAMGTMMKGRRVGDNWANTDVVWVKYVHKPPFDPRDHFCRQCGYDLTGNVSGRCPECGLPVPHELSPGVEAEVVQ